MIELKLGFTANQIIQENRITQEEIDSIKSWSLTKNLPKLTEEQIVLFLLSCNRVIDATKKTICSYYSIKLKSPSIFNNRIIHNDLQKNLNYYEFCVFPERTSDGCAVIFARMYDTYYGNFDLNYGVKLIFMTLDAALYDNPPSGLVIILDMCGLGIMHLTKFRPGPVKTFFDYLQDALPVQLKQIHVFNTAYFIDKVMFLLKPFMSPEVREKIIFHPPNMDKEAFYENWLPKRCMPNDYGGDLPSIHELHEKNTKNMIRLQPFYEHEEMQRQKIVV